METKAKKTGIRKELVRDYLLDWMGWYFNDMLMENKYSDFTTEEWNAIFKAKNKIKNAVIKIA